MCGHQYNLFLDVFSFSKMFLLSGKKDVADASPFCVEQKTVAGKTVYKIIYGKDTPVSLARNEKIPTGKKSLQLGTGKPVKFVLYHKTKSEAELSVALWETEPCYVRILGTGKESPGYMGYNEKTNLVEFVPDLGKEEAGKMWLQCRLDRVRAEGGSVGYSAPRNVRIRPPVRVPVNIDEDSDSELQFGE